MRLIYGVYCVNFDSEKSGWCRVDEVLPFERQLLSHQFVAAVLRDMYGVQVCFQSF